MLKLGKKITLKKHHLKCRFTESQKLQKSEKRILKKYIYLQKRKTKIFEETKPWITAIFNNLQ